MISLNWFKTRSGAQSSYDIGAEIVMLLPDQESHQFANLMDKMESELNKMRGGDKDMRESI